MNERDDGAVPEAESRLTATAPRILRWWIFVWTIPITILAVLAVVFGFSNGAAVSAAWGVLALCVMAQGMWWATTTLEALPAEVRLRRLGRTRTFTGREALVEVHVHPRVGGRLATHVLRVVPATGQPVRVASTWSVGIGASNLYGHPAADLEHLAAEMTSVIAGVDRS